MTLDLPESTMSAIREAKARGDAGDTDSALAAYQALLGEVGGDDYQAAAVLHMYAIVVDDPDEKLRLNQEALERAERSGRFPAPLFASLHANVGYSHRELGDLAEARTCYLKARAAAAGLDDDEYGRNVRDGIEAMLSSLDAAAAG